VDLPCLGGGSLTTGAVADVAVRRAPAPGLSPIEVCVSMFASVWGGTAHVCCLQALGPNNNC